MFDDPTDPYLAFRREYWIKPGILEIEIRLDSWALPLYVSVSPDMIILKLLCLHFWLGFWADKKFWKEYVKNAS